MMFKNYNPFAGKFRNILQQYRPLNNNVNNMANLPGYLTSNAINLVQGIPQKPMHQMSKPPFPWQTKFFQGK